MKKLLILLLISLSTNTLSFSQIENVRIIQCNYLEEYDKNDNIVKAKSTDISFRITKNEIWVHPQYGESFKETRVLKSKFNNIGGYDIEYLSSINSIDNTIVVYAIIKDLDMVILQVEKEKLIFNKCSFYRILND